MKGLKLQKIDELLITAHSCLEESGMCFFLGEYASKEGYQYSDMNQLIFNFKKEMNKKGKFDWHYKSEAIDQIADLISKVPNFNKLKSFTWIPFPPSGTKISNKYDDRLLKVLEKTNGELDIREILISKEDRQPAHLDGSKRQTVEKHLSNLEINEKLICPAPKAIIIFDDIITSVASFKSVQIILRRKFPDIFIVGIFVARAVSYI